MSMVIACVLTLLAVLILLGTAIAFLAAREAPEAVEDEEGFHVVGGTPVPPGTLPQHSPPR
jgi:hypothetical protein